MVVHDTDLCCRIDALLAVLCWRRTSVTCLVRAAPAEDNSYNNKCRKPPILSDPVVRELGFASVVSDDDYH